MHKEKLALTLMAAGRNSAAGTLEGSDRPVNPLMGWFPLSLRIQSYTFSGTVKKETLLCGCQEGPVIPSEVRYDWIPIGIYRV